MSTPSNLEETLAFQIRVAKLPVPIREYKFHPDRRWRSDFVWPKYKVICEVEGGIWKKGRHTNPSGFEKDCEKYNHATLLGYQVIRVTGKHVKSGEALQWIENLLLRLDK